MNYNEVVSRIQNTLNSLNKDMFIPKRFILSVVKSKAEFYMSQRFNDKSLFREINLFHWVKCISLEEVDTINCGKIELQKCSSAMISRKKLPKLIWSRYGASILIVSNILDEKEYKIISPKDYMNMKSKKLFEKFKGRYAILYPDGKIAIPDSTVKKINILLYSLDERIKEFSECDDDIDLCSSYWDTEFNVPVKILDLVIQDSMKEISFKFQIPKDESPDGDQNHKTKTES